MGRNEERESSRWEGERKRIGKEREKNTLIQTPDENFANNFLKN